MRDARTGFRSAGLICLLAFSECTAPPADEQSAGQAGPVVYTAAPMPGDAAQPSPAAPQTNRIGTTSYHSPEIGSPQKTSFGSSYYSPAD
jgi:hypothetical protein